MDRYELKETLRNQVEPISEAVRKKLQYLNSEDVFLTSEDTSDEVFTELLAGNDGADATTASRKVEEPTATIDKIAVHKQSLAEKIAALRGVSSAVPNEYLKRRF